MSTKVTSIRGLSEYSLSWLQRAERLHVSQANLVEAAFKPATLYRKKKRDA